MKFFTKRPEAQGFNMGLFILPIATPDMTMTFVPYVFAGVFLLYGFQLLMHRSFRAGSLLVGASVAMLLTTNLIGW